MKIDRRRLVSAAAAVVFASAAFAGGYWARMWLEAPSGGEGPVMGGTRVASAEEVSRRRPDFEFVDQDGVPRRMADYDGKLVVVNFWATWCPPCVHEIPLLIQFQTRYAEHGVQFVGVALDQSENVRRFAREVGLNYPTAHGQRASFDVMAKFGNRTGGLPFTVIVNRPGDIAFRKVGPVTEAELEQLIRPFI